MISLQFTMDWPSITYSRDFAVKLCSVIYLHPQKQPVAPQISNVAALMTPKLLQNLKSAQSCSCKGKSESPKRGRSVTSKWFRSKAAYRNFEGKTIKAGSQRSTDLCSGCTHDSKAALKSRISKILLLQRQIKIDRSHNLPISISKMGQGLLISTHLAPKSFLRQY